MTRSNANSPLLGYNTNVRHAGRLFHIQTEDSGIDHPHVITHLFTEGTILATKKTSYSELVEAPNREDQIRQLMKDQHKAMFIELRDGVHDEIAARILGESFNAKVSQTVSIPKIKPAEAQPTDGSEPASAEVRVIRPAQISAESDSNIDAETEKEPKKISPQRSIFATPDSNGEFGEDFISDKSLDEVILSYVADELDK